MPYGYPEHRNDELCDNCGEWMPEKLETPKCPICGHVHEVEE